MNPEAIKPNWESVKNRSPIDHVTSAELSQILGVSLQSINNWKLRGVLPKPESNSRILRGNKNFYKISKIREWLEGKSEDEINREWLQKNWGIDDDASPSQMNELVAILKLNTSKVGNEKRI